MRVALVLVALCACGTDTKGAPAEAGPDTLTDDASIDDAGPDVDNGAPSTNYPAPHPPLPMLVNGMGGPVLTSPKVYLVFYPNYSYETQLKDFAQKMVGSSYWTTTTSEYAVGALAYGGAIDLTSETPPGTISQADVQTWVGSEIQSGKFGTPDPQAIYTIVYPSGTTITEPNPVSSLFGTINSCVAFGGYHNNVAVAVGDASAQNFAYAVIPTCIGGISGLTESVSHEWIEAATDPFLTASGSFGVTGGPDSAFFSVDGDHSVWGLLGGGEAGDLCIAEGPGIYITPSDVGYRVQRTWSNLLGKASHDPCAPPISGQAFFDSAPVLDETVTFTSALTGTVTTKGVTIPIGSSKTIEVDLFSDADTGGPWSVTAADLLYTDYGSYGVPSTMDFTWDRTSGVNGEKLHLTIAVTKASLLGAAHAFMITSSLGARTTVWPGLVVE